MLDTSIQIRTDRFDGPLALLLFLIRKEEIDIRSLDLTVVTGQYLDYLSGMHKLDFDVVGDYLYLASTLIFLKSKTAVFGKNLGQPEEQGGGEGPLGIEDHAELVRRLEELDHFQRMGRVLWALPRLGQEVFTKPKVDRKKMADIPLLSMDLERLLVAMMDVIGRQQRSYTVVEKDRVSIEDKLDFLRGVLHRGRETDFAALLGGQAQSIDNIVITFISLLELARLGKVRLSQDEGGGTLRIEVEEALGDFHLGQLEQFEGYRHSLVQ